MFVSLCVCNFACNYLLTRYQITSHSSRCDHHTLTIDQQCAYRFVERSWPTGLIKPCPSLIRYDTIRYICRPHRADINHCTKKAF